MKTYTPYQMLYQNIKKDNPALFDVLNKMESYLSQVAPAINDIQVVPPAVNVVEAPWNALTPINGWSSAGFPYNPPAWRMTGTRVFFMGYMQAGNTTGGTQVLAMPVGSRPVNNIVFMVLGQTAFAGPALPTVFAFIAASGIVQIQSNSLVAGNYVSLEGLNYSTT